MVKRLELKHNDRQILRIENVSKVYKLGEVEFTALSNVSLNIKDGEFVSIAGPSGSGKSTLMYILGLLDKPTTGTVFIEGEATNRFSESQLAALRNQKIGFVFQTFNLLPRTSALANVMLPLQYSNIGLSKREEIAKEMLVKVGLGAKIGNYPSQLSGGEQQRVAIARSLVCNPTIILADEPTGNLDSKSGNQILEILSQLNNEGRTILVVTHDQKIADSTKRVISLMDGKIVSDIQKR